MCLPRVEGRDRMEAIKYKEPFSKRKGRGGACRTKLLLEDLGFQFGIFLTPASKSASLNHGQGKGNNCEQVNIS